MLKLSKDEIIRLYHTEKLTCREIAIKANTSKRSILRLMNEYNIPRRSYSEASRLALAKGRKVKGIGGKGAENPQWRGGRFKVTGGYIRVYCPNHPRVKNYVHPYLYEHILVWEQTHNQLLPNGWAVHHLNGITDDNCPENLVALPAKKHSALLREYKKRIRQLESELKILKRQQNLL